MRHLYICAFCGEKYTEAQAALLPKSDETAVKPMCCGFPINHETWEDEELSVVIHEAVKEAQQPCYLKVMKLL